MVTTDQVSDVLQNGGSVTGTDGTKIGKVGQIFLDDETSKPEWVTVTTGMFGGAESFVPLADASVSGNDIQVSFDKAKVKDAPRVDDSEGHLSKEEEAELYRYYGMDHSKSQSDSGLPEGGTPGRGQDTGEDRGRPAVDQDSSAPTTDDAMTRSEEQLHVGKEKASTGKARLRKHVVTENVTQTVPVSHEEVRIEREPITDANRGDATSGGDITSEEHEMELTEERVTVTKETVPVERVRMDKETVTQDQQVNEEVRKEQIETDTTDGADGTDVGGKRKGPR